MISVDASAALIANEQPPPPGGGRVAIRAGDRFAGTYTCRQGATHVTLTIDDVGQGEEEMTVEARFEFAFDEPGDLEDEVLGAYKMRGKYETKTRRLVLKPDAWIDEPQGWSMVGVRGVLGKAGDTYSGTVDGPGCTVFDTKRESGPGARGN